MAMDAWLATQKGIRVVMAKGVVLHDPKVLFSTKLWAVRKP